MSLDFVFGLPADDKGNTGILVFVCRLSKMVHLAPVRDKVTGKQAAQLFLDSVFRYHGLSETIVSDRDPRFTGAFWDTLFQLLGTKLTMSTADHPQTDGQTERTNRVLEDTLCSICAEAPRSWSDQLPTVEFALNNAVHASTGFIPFYLNGLRHPQVPLTLRGGTVASIVEHLKQYHDPLGSSPRTEDAAYIVDRPKSMATHPTFYVGRLKRCHDPLGPPSLMEEDQGRNRSSAVNAPMELMRLTTKSVQVLTKDLKGPRLASLRGSLTTRFKPKGCLDRINAILKLTDLVA
ncbi:DNA/RNA polymerase [Phytophthora palmivora]|uniref:DNA/RNA polymerase n=1 Tax=Phytophthora palmivora TaxID=4796 RepID=A0A2P4XV71_9STRA|nr:DNA/RNA polymerase [Phytophthora palmivora]